MAKQVGLYKFIGRTGDAIGSSSMKGDVVLKTFKKNPTNPNTVRQRTQRSRFLAATDWGNVIGKDILVGFSHLAKTRRVSVVNAVSSYLMKTPGVITTNTTSQGEILSVVWGSATEPGSVNYTYGDFEFSYGNARVPGLTDIDLETPNTLKVPFTVPVELKDRMGVRVVVYNPEAKTWLISPLTFPVNTPAEGDGQVNMVLPEVWNGTKIHVWAYGQELQNLNASEYNVLALGAASSDLSKADGNSLFSKTTYLGQGTIG